MKPIDNDSLTTLHLIPGHSYTYAQLCNLIGQPQYTGTQKIAQLKDFKRFFDYTRPLNPETNRPGKYFTITTIYSSPIPYKSHPAHNSKYVESIEKILNYFMLENANSSDPAIYFSSAYLFEILGMVNSNYELNKRDNGKRKELISKGQDRGVVLNSVDIDEFYNRTSSKLNDILISSLESLRKRGVLFWNRVYRICKVKRENVDMFGAVSRDVIYYEEATNEETKYILNTKNDVMSKMGYSSERDFIYNKKEKEKYYGELDRMFNEKMGWKKVFLTHKIICSDEWLREMRDIINKEETNERDAKKRELNDRVKQAIIDQAERRGSKMDPGSSYYDYYNKLDETGNKCALAVQRWLSDELITI